MFEEEQICPYTGLRSFTEEESLYFKGREEDIDRATEQLQKNKFLMLTGASGDGKSSLIYAGIIPNARAGFLKSKYTQWCVADFRPERSPFHNLCKAIARQLDIGNLNSVEAELNHGFSAIIDLYKNSKRHLDTNSVAWQSADANGKAALKREAANLVILVDQFEEFFTNPENYIRGVPSRDANLVLNLLLETARIALEEDLPVYVVFTMRSDYIGQCAAFRGLPENIGFSQFFVPRLNRAQLQQVVEEPAVLSGNKITRRLTERLIHDLTEGVDQLPILQHALNQVWHAADNGKEELDLIHYAMVGGMPANELPDEQVERFKKWFEELSPDIKACYHEPSLQNVLDTHTNKLYERADAYYKEKTGKSITDVLAKTIIKAVFTCLTKIDQSRAVRNRMTLKEVTNILGVEGCGTKEVGAVLNIFREPGNTFVRPFITEDPETQVLDDDDILDITHESLIRNWKYLGQWAKEEFDNYTISLDFEQQLNRWVESGKSGNFLLSIGPLTYFENWFKTAKPNAHWIARYLREEGDGDKKLSEANRILENSKEFLTRSAKKYVVTRTVMRYGSRRIAATLGLIAVLTLSSFAVRNYFNRKNDSVLKSIKRQSIELANRPKLSMELPIPVLTEELKAGVVTIDEIINGISDTVQRIKIATGIATQLITQGRYEPKKEILQSLTIADNLLGTLAIPTTPRELAENLKMINNLGIMTEFASLYNSDQALKTILMNNATRAAKWTLHIIKDQPRGFNDMQDLSLALEHSINNKIFTPEQINQLLQDLSPFENGLNTDWLKENYARDKILPRGDYNYGMKFSGLYQDLAYLYVANGNTQKALQCVDTLLHYPEVFYQNDYESYIDNATNIAGVYYTYGNTGSLDEFVEGYCLRKKIGAFEFYNRLVSRSLMDFTVYGNTTFYSGGGFPRFSNLNLSFQPDSMLGFFFQKLKVEASKYNDINERNLSLAVVLKNEAVSKAYRNDIRGNITWQTDSLFEQALRFYQQTSKTYLNQPISFVNVSGTNLMTKPRRFLFLYPDYRVPFAPFEPRSGTIFYQSPAFVKYLLDHNIFDKFYENSDELKYFELWFLDYQYTMCSRDFYQRDQMPFELMATLASKLESRNANQYADLNLLYLHLGNLAFNRGEAEKGIAYLKKIQTEKLLNAFQFYISYVNYHSFELVGKAIADLTANNEFDQAYRLINVFKKEVNRSSLYAYSSQLISLSRKSPEMARRLLDSARTEMKRLDNPAAFQPNRNTVAIALMYLDPVANSKEAYQTIKNNFSKFDAITRFSTAYAFYDKLYQARQQAPRLISSADKSFFLFNTMEGHNYNLPRKQEWAKFNENNFLFMRPFPNYISESQ